MTSHLRPEEFVDAMDGVLSPERQPHLDACDECRRELEVLVTTGRVARTSEVAEPSPLFWDHFGERVREATAASAPGVSIWSMWWRPLGAMAAAAAGIALVVVLRPTPADPGGSFAAAPPSEAATMADDGSWDLVVGLAAELDEADVRAVVKPAEGTADAMLQELTADQREALVRILQQEIGDLQ
jgi:hypothetical protein